jgi:hypothetical protein
MCVHLFANSVGHLVEQAEQGGQEAAGVPGLSQEAQPCTGRQHHLPSNNGNMYSTIYRQIMTICKALSTVK